MVALRLGDRVAILPIELHPQAASGDRLLIVPPAGPSPQRRVALIGGESARWVGEDLQPGANFQRPNRRAEGQRPSRLKPCGRGLEPSLASRVLEMLCPVGISASTGGSGGFGLRPFRSAAVILRRGAVFVTAPRSIRPLALRLARRRLAWPPRSMGFGGLSRPAFDGRMILPLRMSSTVSAGTSVFPPSRDNGGMTPDFSQRNHVPRLKGRPVSCSA